MKTIDRQFAEWFHHRFGYCYGTGEGAIIEALRQWFDCLKNGVSHDYRIAEQKLGPAVEWLLVNVLCPADILEYGSSPRFGWLTKKGGRLSQYMLSKSYEDLVAVVDVEDLTELCSPNGCVCNGGNGTRPCTNNSFWH